jgi:hypothetical protein
MTFDAGVGQKGVYEEDPNSPFNVQGDVTIQLANSYDEVWILIDGAEVGEGGFAQPFSGVSGSFDPQTKGILPDTDFGDPPSLSEFGNISGPVKISTYEDDVFGGTTAVISYFGNIEDNGGPTYIKSAGEINKSKIDSISHEGVPSITMRVYGTDY